MNIAIFGGSFDPPHIGHLQIIDIALRQLDIDKLFVVVAYLNPFKKSSRNDSNLRFEWIKNVTQSFEKVICSDYEIKQNKPVPSIQSVKYFKALMNPKKIYFIIGEDNLYDLKKWNNFDELNALVEFIVFHRECDKKNADISGINMRFIKFNEDISSTIIASDVDSYIDKIPLAIRSKVYNMLKRNKMPYIGNEIALESKNEKMLDIKQKIELIVELLDSKKALDIEVINLENAGYICDYVVIATTMADKHALAILDHLKSELKPLGITFLNVDDTNEEWLIIDLADIIIHLFSENYRKKYDLESFLKIDFRANKSEDINKTT